MTGKTKERLVYRRQTRPIGEFGGNLGCFGWTLFIPTCIWYLYGCVVLNQGRLTIPDQKFWYDLYYTLPEGVAIRPTWKATGAIALWVFFQAVMEIVLPGEIVEGVRLKNGRKLKYPMNGLKAFILSHVVCYGLCWYGLLSPWFIWENMGALITSAVIIVTLMALWLYIDFGLLWYRHVDDPEFEEDWGVFSWKECINDFWLGVARNPRLFHSTLVIPFDLKRFWNARPGLTLWVIANQSYIAAMYFNCKLIAGEPTCAATGDWTRISPGAVVVALAHWYYILDYNWNEPAYLTTTDIRHDLFGWMLTYGDFGFLCWYYSFAYCGYLAWQDRPLTHNWEFVIAGTVIHILAMILFRWSNIQKHYFRTYIAEGGDLADYKVWGKPVEYIHTEEGSYLLLSGFWGLARHFNYIGDLVMCIGWVLLCSGSGHPFPFVPVSYCIYFWLMDIHRMFRDEHRCRAKYKTDWEKYEMLVPYRILPRVF
jgi:protein-S-isoprenylcysteine O-methyltransferase Ste14